MRARAIALFVTGVLLSASGILPNSAWGQGSPAPAPAVGFQSSAIGRVVSAKGVVSIERANAVVVQANVASGGAAGQTKVGDPVYKGDVVQTGADGAVGITFTDGTAFNLASNARMVLNEFVYDPNGKSNSTLFSLTKGTFTFIAGKVAKTGDMKIDTPVATMGIRGTTPRVEISDDGTVSFSTLIEEKKSATDRGGVAPPVKQRQAKSVPPPMDSSSVQVDRKLDKKLNINLNICRGC